MEKKNLPILLGVWLAANFLPPALVFLASGRVPYQLPPLWVLAMEWCVVLLNALLPVAADAFFFHEQGSAAARLSWRWKGWRTLAWGVAGVVVFLGLAYVAEHSIARAVSSPIQRFSSIIELVLLLLLLLVLTAPGEETMFRGWLQPHFIRSCGVWGGIALTAFLFGLRYLPMDLYSGISTHAGLLEWSARLLELYGLAFILGVVRHFSGSTWASWLVRESVLILAVVLAVVGSG